MDEAVDQIMGRSTDEKGADKANAVRKSQQRDRANLAKDIEANQKIVAQLNDEAAPIRAEVRKVEAEVGPIKYIAKFIYGEHGADENMLEKAVTWIIVLIVVVFDPLAVIMLLAAQMTFGWKRDTTDEGKLIQDSNGTIVGIVPAYVEPEKEQTHTEEVPSETPLTALGGDITAPEEPTVEPVESELDKWNKMVEEAEKEVARAREEASMQDRLATGETYINAEGNEVRLITRGPIFPENPTDGDTHSRTDFDPEREFTFNGSQWVESSTYKASTFPEQDLPVDEESKKKTYMIKDQEGSIQIKTR
jgi:hypothetical protein